MTIMQDRPESASFDDAADHARGLSDHQLLCRERNRHDFEPPPMGTGIPIDAKYHPADQEWESVTACRCGVRQVKRISVVTFTVTSQRPDYSDVPDYLMKGLGRIGSEGRRAIRRERMLERGGLNMRSIRNADRRYAKQKAADDG